MARSKWIGRRVVPVGCGDRDDPCTLYEVTGEYSRYKIWITPVDGVGYQEAELVLKRDVQKIPTAAEARANEPCPGCGEKRAMCQCLERAYARQVKEAGLPEPVEQYVFDPDRKWRSDFGFVDWMVLVEIEGGTYRSRHKETAGFERDAEKYNRAAVKGFFVLRFTTKMVKNGTAAAVTELILRTRGWHESV